MKSRLLIYLLFVWCSAFLHCDGFAKIIYSHPPDGGMQIVSNFVSETLQSNPSFYKGLQMKDLKLSAPYPSYFVVPQDLVSNRLLSAATPGGGWTYLILQGTNAVLEANLFTTSKTGKVHVDALSRPFYPNAPLDALRAAEQSLLTQKQDYEVRKLECPSLLFHAMWLHGKSDDIIIPLPLTFGRWQENLPYSEREMLYLLKPEAEKKLKQKELPGAVD